MGSENFIGGKWVAARDGRTDDVVNPATADVIATVASSDVCSGRTTHNGWATVQPGIRPGWSASRAKTLSVVWSVEILLGVIASWSACRSAFSNIGTSMP